jgi:urease accessory protein UreH
VVTSPLGFPVGLNPHLNSLLQWIPHTYIVSRANPSFLWLNSILLQESAEFCFWDHLLVGFNPLNLWLL